MKEVISKIILLDSVTRDRITLTKPIQKNTRTDIETYNKTYLLNNTIALINNLSIQVNNTAIGTSWMMQRYGLVFMCAKRVYVIHTY